MKPLPLLLLAAVLAGAPVAAPQTAPQAPDAAQAQEGGGYRAGLPFDALNTQPAVALPLASQPVTETLGDSASMPVPAAPAPSGGIGTALVGGWASWFEAPAHTAAAGPLIREALGHWRGKTIRVTSGRRSTLVILRDFCACGYRHGVPTLIDLSPDAFADLAPLSQGLVRVEIELVVLPATDTTGIPRTDADMRMMEEVRGDELYR